MKYWDHIYFKDKSEYADVEVTLTKHQIGQVLFSVLAVDWDGLASEMS